MIEDSVRHLLQDASINKRSSWAIVRNGTVAEFSVTEGDVIHKEFNYDTDTLTVETNRALLEIQINDSLTAVVAENANYRCSPWSQNIYLCIPKKDSELPTRNKLTQIGEYSRNEMNGIVWDLGIGYSDFQQKL